MLQAVSIGTAIASMISFFICFSLFCCPTRIRSLLCQYRGACLTWRDTAPIRRLTLVYPLPQHLPITLQSPLFSLEFSFTVKIHTNIFFIAQIGARCQSSASTPGQPHRVAPTITRNGRITGELRPICTKRTPRDSDTWRRKLWSVRRTHTTECLFRQFR